MKLKSKIANAKNGEITLIYYLNKDKVTDELIFKINQRIFKFQYMIIVIINKFIIIII